MALTHGGLVHTVTTTDAATTDITQLDDLLHGHETPLYGDKACRKESKWQRLTRDDGAYRINRRGKRAPSWDKTSRNRSHVRALHERVLHVIHWLWNFAKLPYRGLAMRTARV